MTNEQINEMADRFLRWELPQGFYPDCGISYTPLPEHYRKPVGTNLFTHNQAVAMIRYMLNETK